MFRLLGMMLAFSMGLGTGVVAMAQSEQSPPPVAREFRAVWVATVQNIDWPSKPGLSVDEQKAEAIAILDRCVELNMNAVIFQVRTTADAFYDSKFEPWSEYLTGEQGKNPGYDPLAFWVEESHKRGLELHAWFNPYRAKHSQSKRELHESHVGVRRPDLAKSYGGFLWLDPGEIEAEDQSYNVFMDVVERYNVDGIHIDDYFYPYPVQDDQKNEIPFPDDNSWNRYQRMGGTLSRDDWRRQNVDRFVHRIYEGIRARKPHVKFGISPFGLGKPSLRTDGIRGFSQYDKLYADAELWLNNGWCDYWTPQLYWPTDRVGQQFELLLNYWARQNAHNRHYWPGVGTYRYYDNNADRDVPEIVKQIEMTRSNPQSSGHVHFSMKSIMKDWKGEAPQLRAKLDEGLKEVYAKPALIPASPWLDNTAPEAPKVRIENGKLSIDHGEEAPFLYVLYKKQGDEWMHEIVPASASIDAREVAFISAVDRTGNESALTAVGD